VAEIKGPAERQARKSLSEQHPPLSSQEALVESNRCLFCYDAPCTHACPTHIDIPRFIKKISTDTRGVALKILASRIVRADARRLSVEIFLMNLGMSICVGQA